MSKDAISVKSNGLRNELKEIRREVDSILSNRPQDVQQKEQELQDIEDGKLKSCQM